MRRASWKTICSFGRKRGKSEVLEEYLHNVQRRVGLTETLTPWQMEIHVKEFMLRHRKLLGISDADGGWLKIWLDKAQGP